MTSTSLAQRLRELRVQARLTQLVLGRALGVSVPLISSWEKDTTPPIKRVEEYARLFARAQPDVPPALVDRAHLTAAEQTRYRDLHAELLGLRSGAMATSSTAEPASPMQFGAGQAITIVCSKLPPERRAAFGSPHADDADHIDSYKYADIDALIELLPFVGALNPASRIAVGTVDELSNDHLTAHLITLGGVDWNPVTHALMAYLHDVPVAQLRRDSDLDVGGFAVRRKGAPEQHMLLPRVKSVPGKQILIEDVAHFLRAPNPYNRQRTLTMFNGSFNRGSHGMVRALTDPKIQERNAAHVVSRLSESETYSVVSPVRIVANEIIVPDWTLAADRLHEWPEARD